MKASKRLKASLAAIAANNAKALQAYRALHPVSTGLIPFVPYVPPTGQGKGMDMARAKVIAQSQPVALVPTMPNYETTVESNLARVSGWELFDTSHERGTD